MYSCLLYCVTCLCSVLKTTVRPVEDVVQNDISRFVNSSSPSKSRTYSNPVNKYYENHRNKNKNVKCFITRNVIFINFN